MHAGPWKSLGLLALLALIGPLVDSSGNMDVDRYEDDLLQSLYKRLSEIDSNYFINSLDDGGDEYREARDEVLSGLGKGPSAAAIRDAEYIEHSSHGNEGFLQMSGGAGEGKQHLMPDGSVDNVQPEGSSIVKSDKSLPFYCHPPNPCPKGFTSAANGCDEGVEDTAEAQKSLISRMQAEGFCTCDQEHMFDCQAPSIGDNKLSQNGLNDVVDKILSDRAAATYMSGEKRQTLVAKKSPRIKRMSDLHQSEM